MDSHDKIPEYCPHCGRRLSPWEQVLLSVDRALMCKGCWYRILLDISDNPQTEPPIKHTKNKDDKK
ncbi:hypothetical protein EH223_14385 [candidate division KSB1 bacterium]|nr:hypothetical protein [candidate division KSB1 bacterium]RQW01670.1 MAG: hypothetical protein EH223_14385 [candidate division KSB1 bacterium]